MGEGCILQILHVIRFPSIGFVDVNSSFLRERTQTVLERPGLFRVVYGQSRDHAK